MKGSANKALIAPRPPASAPWAFFAAVFCWTWFFWLLAAAFGVSARSASGIALEIFGLLGPMLGGIGFAYLTLSREGWRDYWMRIFDPTRIATIWYAVIFLFVPALLATAVLLDVAAGGVSTLTLVGERMARVASAPMALLVFVPRVFVYGPLPEELGWRGYALDRLQARWDAPTSSLVLGAIWALWHVPLFFIKDTLFYDQGLWSAWFFLFILSVIPTAVVYTWIFNNTRRSTLAAILFHFMSNLSYELANVTDRTNLLATLLWIAAAVAVVAFWGAGSLTRGAPDTRD
jgi:membrane protease YdiL (CAAX protease family)